VIIGTIIVDGLTVDDFLDRRTSEISGYFPPMPQQALLKSGQYLKIDRIIVKHGKVTYTEQAGTEPGVLFFTDMEANLTNLTNDPQLVRKRTIMEFNGTGLLMGKGRFSGTFRFPLGAPGDPFTFSGELSHMEMKEINPMMTKLVPLEIRSGDVDRLIIPPIQANDDEASGKMEFCYHGLNIRLLNQGTDAWSRIKTTVMNTAATMIIKKENPSTGGTLREGIINFRRNKSASFFNFVWKSALTGLKSTIGINTREQKKLKKEGKKN
jgi:hypothetical protein